MIRQQRKRLIATCLTCALLTAISAQAQFLPSPTQEAKPGIRWWWMGSAVDKENLGWNLDQYAKAGIGAVEITPLYGVQGNDKNDIPYLSPRWMEMLRFVVTMMPVFMARSVIHPSAQALLGPNRVSSSFPRLKSK